MNMMNVDWGGEGAAKEVHRSNAPIHKHIRRSGVASIRHRIVVDPLTGVDGEWTGGTAIPATIPAAISAADSQQSAQTDVL